MEEYLDTNDPISIKFKGIEMRGINDGQAISRSHPALEVRYSFIITGMHLI